ncbi:hypothetical protein [uncultured Nocardioides sp.]|uniref:hypothetical protein n=1 Tax=uncultured Nocardioides sp. TaxID=198441 RepID=UPI000C6B07ED|nr:hypothetical protein [Nocardioides sp.]
MPGKHAATQSRLLRPIPNLSTATSVGAHRSSTSGSRIGRTSSLAAIGLAGTLALTLGGVAVGDEDQPSIGPDDFALLPATSSGGGSSSVGFLDPLRRVSQVVTVAAADPESGAAEQPETYRPRHRAESTASIGTRDQAGSRGDGTNGTSEGDTSPAADEPGTARSATDAVVDTVRSTADRAPEQTDPLVDPLVDATDESLSGAADIVDGLLP